MTIEILILVCVFYTLIVYAFGFWCIRRLVAIFRRQMETFNYDDYFRPLCERPECDSETIVRGGIRQCSTCGRPARTTR